MSPPIGIGIGIGIGGKKPAPRPPDYDDIGSWHYADDPGIVVATGVSSWPDRGPNARPLVQATGSQQPTLNATGGPDGGAAVEFDGTDDVLEVAFTQAQPQHVFMALIPSIGDDTSGGILDGATLNTRRIYVAAANLLGSNGGLGLNANAVGLIDTWVYLELIFDGLAGSFIVNDQAASTGNIGTATADGLHLGSSGSGLDRGDPSVAELLIYTSTRSAAQLTDIRTWFTDRYPSLTTP